MAFDFPNSPSVGQIATGPGGQSYQFDGSKWIVLGGTTPGWIVISDIAPANPPVGMLWLDSIGMQLYCYYQDPSSSQWISVTNQALLGYLALTGGTLTGPLTPAGGIVGKTDGSNAVAGQVGEVISAVNSAGTAMSTGATINIVSIALTPGDWDIEGSVFFGSTTAAISNCAGGINSASAALPPVPGFAQANLSGGALITGFGAAVPPYRANVSASTTLYLAGVAVFASGVTTGYGQLIARRRR